MNRAITATIPAVIPMTAEAAMIAEVLPVIAVGVMGVVAAATEKKAGSGLAAS